MTTPTGNSGAAATIEQHLTILGALHLAYGLMIVLVGGLAAAIAGLAALVIPVSRATPGTPGPVLPVAIGALVMVLALLAVAVALLGIVSGIGLLGRRPWARTLALVQAVLILISFPLGTALGVYTLWVLTRTDVTNRLTTGTPAGAAA